MTPKLRWLFPSEKMQHKPVLLGRCQMEATEAEELELMDSKRHVTQLSILELAGFFKALFKLFFLRRNKDLKTKGSIYYHMSLWELPPS